MIFLNIGALFGMAAISVPIVIHLLNRFQVRRITWAAMRFLAESMEKNRRQIQLESILLLLLRCLLLALLVLALARPSWVTNLAMLGQHNVAAVIIIDDSMSMGLTDGIENRLELAKSAAEQILQSMPSGSSSALFLAADNVDPVVDTPTDDFNLLRSRIRQVKLTGRSTNLSLALQSAVDTLQKQNQAKEIYLITDGQANGWPSLASLQKELQGLQGQIAVHLVLVGNSGANNLAITDLQVGSGLIPVNQQLRFDVEVSNFGDAAVQNVPVSLHVDDDPGASDETSIDSIPPGGSSHVGLFAKLREEGYHSVTAKITPDRLPTDDQRTVAVRAILQVNVLLINGTNPIIPRQADDFFLRNALVPVPSSEVSQYYIKTTTVTPTQLSGLSLDDFSAVFLLNVPTLPDEMVQPLMDYVNRGGGVVVFPGPESDIDWYNQKLNNFLPAKIGLLKGQAGQQDHFFTLQPRDYEHPIVSLWNDPGAGTLATAHFFAYYALNPIAWKPEMPFGQPQSIVHFNNSDDPLAMEHTWGAGRVMLFASTATTAWNDLPIHQAFLPLVQRLVGSLLQRQDEGLNIRAGQELVRSVGSDLVDKPVSVILPGSKESRLVGPVGLINGIPGIRFKDTDAVGAYHVKIGESPLCFAVQSDPVESNLTVLSADQLSVIAQVAEVIHWNSGISLTHKLTEARVGHEFGEEFLIIALLAAVMEMVLAQYFSQPK